MTGSDREPQIGSIGEEAAKLLQTLQAWATESSRHEVGDSQANADAAASGLLGSIGRHIPTGDRECTFCPVCRAIAAARATSPEVRQHLAAATYSFVQAVSGMLALHVAEGDDEAADDPIEHIDVERHDERSNR